MKWIPVGTKTPDTEKAVLATVVIGDRRDVIRACYVPKFTVEDRGNYEGDSDYDEERDCYYWPEGWYEWNEHEDTHWQVDDEVLAWMPLPEPYETERIADGTYVAVMD